jgi:hypothetical protein
MLFRKVHYGKQLESSPSQTIPTLIGTTNETLLRVRVPAWSNQLSINSASQIIKVEGSSSRNNKSIVPSYLPSIQVRNYHTERSDTKTSPLNGYEPIKIQPTKARLLKKEVIPYHGEERHIQSLR